MGRQRGRPDRAELRVDVSAGASRPRVLARTLAQFGVRQLKLSRIRIVVQEGPTALRRIIARC